VDILSLSRVLPLLNLSTTQPLRPDLHAPQRQRSRADPLLDLHTSRLSPIEHLLRAFRVKCPIESPGAEGSSPHTRSMITVVDLLSLVSPMGSWPTHCPCDSCLCLLLHLFEVETGSPFTIESFRSNNHGLERRRTVSPRLLSVGQVLKSFKTERPRSVRRVPKGISSALQTTVSFDRNLWDCFSNTQTVFYCDCCRCCRLLASARRRDDIHAMDPICVTSHAEL
jgi:hypothetical protein